MRYTNHPRIRMEFNQENSGSAFKQWNKGVRMSKRAFVWIAESDDYADPRFLERLVPFLDSESENASVYCRSWYFKPDGRTNGFSDP
jgi:Glycosyl transferase family 2